MGRPTAWVLVAGLLTATLAACASGPATRGADDRVAASAGVGWASGAGAGAGAAPSATADPAEQAAVGDVWWRYLQAVRQRDGAAAAATVTAATLARYDGLRDAALHADRAVLERLPLTDQLTVMVWRARVPVAVLRGGDARALLASSVEVGLNGDGTSSGLADAVPDGDIAVGHYLRGTDGSMATVRFRRESGVWRLDLRSLLDAAEAATTRQWTQSGLVRGEFVARALAADLTPAQVAQAYAPPT